VRLGPGLSDVDGEGEEMVLNEGLVGAVFGRGVAERIGLCGGSGEVVDAEVVAFGEGFGEAVGERALGRISYSRASDW